MIYLICYFFLNSGISFSFCCMSLKHFVSNLLLRRTEPSVFLVLKRYQTVTCRYLLTDSLWCIKQLQATYRRKYLWHVYNEVLQKCICRLHYVCLNIHPSVHHMQQLTNHSLDFHEIWCSGVLLKFVDLFPFRLKSESINVYFTLRSAHISTFISSITQMYLTTYISEWNRVWIKVVKKI